jgi:hypothetical protein
MSRCVGVADTEGKARRLHLARETVGSVGHERDRDIHVRAQSRNPVDGHGLCTEHAPAAPPFGDRHQGREQFNGGGLHRHGEAARPYWRGTADPPRASRRPASRDRTGASGAVARPQRESLRAHDRLFDRGVQTAPCLRGNPRCAGGRAAPHKGHSVNHARENSVNGSYRHCRFDPRSRRRCGITSTAPCLSGKRGRSPPMRSTR